MVNIAVILSGCGHMDGSEIRESLFVALGLERQGARYTFFAPDMDFAVINHLTGEPTKEIRNALAEAARIARGEIFDVETLEVDKFAALILPGGMGAIKNLSNIQQEESKPTILAGVKRVITAFWQAKKPIGAICISPVVVTAALAGKAEVLVTLGSEHNCSMIESLGGKHQACRASEVVVDKKNLIFTTPAYMTTETMHSISLGIFKLTEEICKACTTTILSR